MADSTINVNVELQRILAAVYGEEVRGSIHDAIQAIATACNAWLGLQDGTVTTSKLAQTPGSEAVTRATIQDHAVNIDKIAEDVGFRKDSNDILYFGGSGST